MSVCRFIASDMPLTMFEPPQEYPFHVNIDEGIIDDGRAKQIIEYIKNALLETDNVEFWLIWLMDYYEYEERPFIHRYEISIDELTIDDINEINSANIWNHPDLMYPNRPSFYCLKIIR